MAKEKVEKYSRRMLRQLDLLSHYYNIDREHNIIDLEIKTEKASDFIVDDVSSIERPMFKAEIIERVSQIIDHFPTGFKVNLILKIDDYEGIDPDLLLTSLKDSLEVLHYSIHRETNKNWLVAAILIIVSALIIFLKITLTNLKQISSDGLLYEIIDISAWVFTWEGITILFLSHSDKKEIALKIGKRLVNISLKDHDNNIIRTVSKNDYVKQWINETRRESAGKALMVISGAACLVTSIISIVSTTIDIFQIASNADANLDVIYVVISYIEGILFIIGGLGILSMYQERGKLQKVVPFFAYTFLVFDSLLFTALIVLFITAGCFDISILFNVIKSSIVTILYFVSYLIVNKCRKNDKNKN